MKSFKQYCKEDLSIEDADGKVYAEIVDIIKPEPMKVPQSNIYYEDPIEESIRIPSKTGNIITVYLAWRGSSYNIQMFFPQRARPLKKNVQYELNKVYPGSKVLYFDASDKDPTKPLLVIDS